MKIDDLYHAIISALEQTKIRRPKGKAVNIYVSECFYKDILEEIDESDLRFLKKSLLNDEKRLFLGNKIHVVSGDNHAPFKVFVEEVPHSFIKMGEK